MNGVVASVLSLKNSLEKLGHDVRILTLKQEGLPNDEPGVYYVKSISAEKIYPHARVMCSTGKHEIAAILDWKPDIVHSQCEFSTFYFARKIAKRLQIPIVHTYHTVYEDYTHYFSPSKVIGKKMARKMSRTFLNRTQAVVAPTNKVRNILNSYDIMKPITVIPTGIELKRVSRSVSAEEITALKQKYSISETDKIVLFLGRLAKEKNVDELITLFGGLNRDDLTFVIVGDGPDRERLENCAAVSPKSSKIIFTGMVSPEEVTLYYNLGDLFVSASTSETQGLTYIEALANGIPSLCRKDPCIEDVVVNYENGYQYSNAEEFVNFLNFFFSGECDRAQLRHNAFLSGKAYSSEAFGSRMEKYYLDTLELFANRSGSFGFPVKKTLKL